MGLFVKSYSLNASERDLLIELDKIIDWHIDSGKPMPSLLLSKRQKRGKAAVNSIMFMARWSWSLISLIVVRFIEG